MEANRLRNLSTSSLAALASLTASGLNCFSSTYSTNFEIRQPASLPESKEKWSFSCQSHIAPTLRWLPLLNPDGWNSITMIHQPRSSILIRERPFWKMPRGTNVSFATSAMIFEWSIQFGGCDWRLFNPVKSVETLWHRVAHCAIQSAWTGCWSEE